MKPNTSRPQPEVLNVDFSSKNVFRSMNLLLTEPRTYFFFPARLDHRKCENRRANMEQHGGCTWGAPGLSWAAPVASRALYLIPGVL